MRGRSGLASGKLDLAGFGSAPANVGPPRRFGRAARLLVMMMARQLAAQTMAGREGMRAGRRPWTALHKTNRKAGLQAAFR